MGLLEDLKEDNLGAQAPRPFQQEEPNRLQPQPPRDFTQAAADSDRAAVAISAFDQEESDRSDPLPYTPFNQELPDSDRVSLEIPEFQQQESDRTQAEEPRRFSQELSDDAREEPELSFASGERLAELRDQAEQETLDNWNTSKNFLDQPFVLTRPDSGRLDIPAGTHTVPGRKLAEHEARLGKFLATPKGALFNLTQGALQVQQGRQQTRIYNPAAGLASSAPTVNVERHAGGLDWDEEIEQATGGEGYLKQLTNGSESLTESGGVAYRAQMRGLLSSNMPQMDPNKWSRIPQGQRWLAEEVQEVQQGEYDVFLGMFEYEGPDGNPRFDAYNPTLPYTATDGEVETPDGIPNINKPQEPRLRQQSRYDSLQEKNESARQEALDNPDQYRLDGETPFRRPEEIPGPRATSGEDPPGPYVSDQEEADKFHENQVGGEGEEFVLHRLPSNDDRTTHGLPNHSLSGLNVDQINALPVEDYDPDAAEEPVLETEGGENRQLVDFRIYDYINRKRLVFRPYLEGISISHEVDWSSSRYSGRPEKYHIYGGASRSVDFSFSAFAESEQAFEALWNKVNYLEGMVYPSAFAELDGGGAYMVAPFAQLTIGNFYRQQFGFIESLDFDVNDDYPWETTPGKQLTKGVDVNISYTIIEEDLPATGDDFIKGDFIQDR